MLNKEALQRQVQEIELLINYAVGEIEQNLALDFLQRFHEDSFALDVIQDYYRTLPEAREEPLVKISVLERKEQVFLLLLSTNRHHYFYLANDEEGLFIGQWEEGLSAPQVLSFFGYPHQDAFAREHQSLDNCREYIALERVDEDICPSCGVESGNLHTLGCPVEVCPWCGGQLSRCNCRFEQLGVEELEDEKMLEELEGRLEDKGRIPYAREQRPSFLAE
ncbi:MAG: hypothetical protein KKD01_08480 [Proteobacteria bacterium]|nr:hypothetical protein [Pseudomonadota bacterium]MBU1140808.1 hypothetical protein [Pseudomonadota bacterium]MBU1234974.1 hypothetical protein [Pseudomonadota bacterium]MBU1417595.1 hypothetical protein [Pseudomonadota bacterium]MBU1454746.1 hypothetical protein [Pseudomonadota bacterium]